jgi:hypothetical protein
MYRSALLCLLLTFAACESDAAKLERLEAEAELAAIQAEEAERALEEVGALLGGPEADSARAIARAARSRATLAKRELDRFLR